MVIPVRTVVILSLATGGGIAALYLTSSSPVVTATGATVAACRRAHEAG
jgi:hypothetical protein